MKKTIEISSELHLRLGKIAQVFETEQNVIERLVDFYESKFFSNGVALSTDHATEQTLSLPLTREFHKLEVNYYPRDLKQFKSFLLKTKKAWVKLSYKDGSATIYEWNSLRFSETSDVRGNLNSGYLRDWREKGIVRADVAIDKSDLP
jgi:hypothetical protein